METVTRSLKNGVRNSSATLRNSSIKASNQKGLTDCSHTISFYDEQNEIQRDNDQSAEHESFTILRNLLPVDLVFSLNNKRMQKKSFESMEGKLCVITGATSGVGYETAKQLVLNKANLVMVARNKSKAERIKNEFLLYNNLSKIDIVVADFSRLREVQEAAEAICASYKHIDVLINCAGLHSTTKKYTEDGYELVFCVNHLASLLFTMLLQDVLISSAPSRVIQVNAEGHRYNGLAVDDLNWKARTYSALQGYGASKSAQLMTVWELSDRLFSKGVTVNAVHPGAVKTSIGSNNGFYYRICCALFKNQHLRDAAISGESIYYIASSSELKDVSGQYFNLTHQEKPAKHTLDKCLGKKVFDQSVQMISKYL